MKKQILLISIFLSSALSIICSASEKACWRFNEGTGTIANDSIYGFNGTINGAVWVSGKNSYALSYDGADDYVDMGDQSELEGLPQLTLSAWVYPTSVGINTQYIMGKEWVYKIDIQTSKIRFLTGTTSGVWANTILTSNMTIQNNQWYHIVATYDGTMKRLYINGVEDCSIAVTGNLLTSANHVTIGSYYYSVGTYWDDFNGKIDDARIYDVALTKYEVSEQFLQKAYWKLNEMSGTIAYDSAYGYNGTINGATIVNGKTGNALSFDGDRDYVDMGDIAELEGMSQLSLSAWVYPKAIGNGNEYIMGKEWVYKLDIDSAGKLRFLTGTTGGVWANTILTSSQTLQNNKWYHITATYDGTTKKLYINGALDNSRATTGNLLTSANHVTIGSYYYAVGDYRNSFSGVIDDARIYGKALSPADWTFMIYVNADNNLHDCGIEDINEMELINLANSSIHNVIVLYDGLYSPNADTRLYRITYDSTGSSSIVSPQLASTELGLTISGSEELNLGDPNTLSNFINFCKSKYKAENYMLVIWNHGNGWRGPEGGLYKSVSFDDTNGDQLYMQEVRNAVQGKRIEVTGFDACLMGMIEVGYELRGHTKYMVGSEDTEPGDGWEYNIFFNNCLQTFPSPENFCIAAIDAYKTKYQNSSYVTLSAVDLSEIPRIVQSLNSFSNAIYAYCTTDAKRDSIYTNIISYAQNFSYYYHIDLWDLAASIRDNYSFADNQANDLIAKISNAVIAEWHIGAYNDAHGIAINFNIPNNYDYWRGSSGTMLPLFVTDGNNAWVPVYPNGPGLIYRLQVENLP